MRCERIHRETCLLGEWSPALRRRELILGCYMERGNLSFRYQGRTSSGSPDKRESTNAKHRGGSVRSSEEASVMGEERRDRHIQALEEPSTVNRMSGSIKARPFEIPKQLVMEAWILVKRNGGAPGIDGQTLEMFERKLKANLYKIWSRMSSGCYFPQAVLRVEIPKKSGGKRPLGIPTVSDRIAQMTARLCFEPQVEPTFHPDSYGYRPNKSAHQAVGQARKRCWEYAWVIDLDIKGFFDTINHDLMMKAVDYYKPTKWVRLYIERWLKAPADDGKGNKIERTVGTPQGGVISPLLANMFLHFTFDRWMAKNYSSNPFERYADDIVIHCSTKEKAEELLSQIKNRMTACFLQVHPEKTKIVYCKDRNRKESYERIEFDFLGFTFRPRMARSKSGKMFLAFTPAISKKSSQAIKDTIRTWKIHRAVEADLERLSLLYNAKIRGWITYYGKYRISEMYGIFCMFQKILVKWAKCKFKKLKGSWLKASRFISGIAVRCKFLFAHWELGWLANGRI